MPGPVFTKSEKDKSDGKAEGCTPKLASHPISFDPYADILYFQNTAGNQAVNQLLQTDKNGVPPIVQDVLSCGNGQPLDPIVRELMESRFNHDFSQVQVHTDAKAGESARAVDALAYTVGNDVVFRAGQYQPKAEEGQRLLAHELTHVVQQSGNHATASHSGAAHEYEADQASNAVFSGTGQFQVHLAAQMGIARAPASTPPVSGTAGGLSFTGGTPAMTPEDMFNKLVNRYFDEHIPVHQVEDAEKYLEVVKKRLESMEAEFKKTPTDELKKGIKTLKSDYKKMQDRIAISKFEGPGAMAGRGDDTHVIIQVVDKDGYIVKDSKGNDLVAYGKNIKGGKHAEQMAIDQFEKQLGERKIPGARIEVVGDQEVCHDICEPALQDFAKKHDIESVDGHEFKRPKVVGEGEATSKQTSTTATKKSSEGLELKKRSKNIYKKTGHVPTGPGGGSPSVKEKTTPPAEGIPEAKPDAGAKVAHEPETAKAPTGQPKKSTSAHGEVPEPGIPVGKLKTPPEKANFEGAYLAAGEAEHAKIAIKGLFSNMAAGVALGILQDTFKDMVAKEIEQLPKLELDNRSLADFLTAPNSGKSVNLFYLLHRNIKSFQDELNSNDALLISSFKLELVDIATTHDVEKRLGRLEVINAKLQAYEDWLLIINNNMDALHEQESRFRETKEAADSLLKLMSLLGTQSFLVNNGVSYDQILNGGAILKSLSVSIDSSLKETNELRSEVERLLSEEMTFARQIKKIWLNDFTEYIRLKQKKDEEAARARSDTQVPGITVPPLR